MQRARPMEAKSETRRLTQQDADSFHSLFEAVFGHRCSAWMYQWKYRDIPAQSYGFFEGGRLIAHCAIFPRRMHAFGAPSTAVQLADLMALRHRAAGYLSGFARKSSPFFRTIDLLLNDLHQQPFPSIAFGFPSRRALRLGERLGVFTPIDDLYELTIEPRAHFSILHCNLRHHSISTCRGSLASVWQQMMSSFADYLICDRDPDYIAHRYFDHPHFRYRVIEIRHRLKGSTLGFFVLKENDSSYEIADVICHRKRLRACLEFASGYAHREGGFPLKIWLTSAFADVADDLASEKLPLELRIMASPRQKEPTLARMQGKWFLTSGDTDYR